jgi:Co/Zn/Cd efflux system component
MVSVNGDIKMEAIEKMTASREVNMIRAFGLVAFAAVTVNMLLIVVELSAK